MHLRLASKPLISSLRAAQRVERRLNPQNAAGASNGWEPPSGRPQGNGTVDHWSAAAEDPREKEKRRRSASPRREREDRYREKEGDPRRR